MISVSELKKILLEIDNCPEIITETLDDGTVYQERCTIQCMCDKCIDRIAGLLEWAEDEEAGNPTQPPNCS